MRVVDISDDWKVKNALISSFDEVCYELGVPSPKDKIDGSEVNYLYHMNDLESIKEYCNKDVGSLMDVGKIMYQL